MKRVLWGSAALLLIGAGVVSADDLSLSAEKAPSEESVRVSIQGLSSVRDYERLRWILNAVEAQDASARSALLAELDAQVDRLTRAKVVTVETSAQASPVSAEPAGTAPEVNANPLAVAEEVVPIASTEAPEASLARERARQEGVQRAVEAETEIATAALSEDGNAREEQMRDLYGRINQVKNPEAHDRLVERLRAREGEIVARQFEVYRQRIIDEMTRAAAQLQPAAL